MKHEYLDARSLALHRLIAAKIRNDPVLFEKVRATIGRFRRIVCANSQPYLIEWERAIDQGIDAALALATEESEHATALRQASPFAGILTEPERLAFLAQWKRDHAHER